MISEISGRKESAAYMDQLRSRTSLLMLTASMVIFGTIGIFRRYILLSSGMLAFGRGLIGVLFLCAFMKIRGRKIFHASERAGSSRSETIGRKNLLWLTVSGAAIGFNWILLFEAYNYTTVAVATLCYYMQPTIVILLSPLLLREKLTVRKLICAGAAILGMIFVSGIIDAGDGPSGSFKGVLSGLGAAALYASVIIMNKKISGIDPIKKTVLQLAAATVVMIPYLLITEDFSQIEPDGRSILLLIIVGLIHTGMAYAMYFGSMEGLKGQTIAIFSYIDPITALILSSLILKESLSAFGIIGAVLILGAAFASEIGTG